MRSRGTKATQGINGDAAQLQRWLDAAARTAALGAVRLIDLALDLFEQSGSHSKGALARDGKGRTVKPSSPHAVAWDVNGALCKVARADKLDATTALGLATDLTALAAIERGYRSAMHCNDTLGKPGAVWMLRRARDLADTEREP